MSLQRIETGAGKVHLLCWRHALPAKDFLLPTHEEDRRTTRTQAQKMLETCLRQVVLNTHSPEVARQMSLADVVFVEHALTRRHGPVSVFRPVVDQWRAKPAVDEEDAIEPVPQQTVADFIGGSPVHRSFDQLEIAFGSAR